MTIDSAPDVPVGQMHVDERLHEFIYNELCVDTHDVPDPAQATVDRPRHEHLRNGVPICPLWTKTSTQRTTIEAPRTS